MSCIILVGGHGTGKSYWISNNVKNPINITSDLIRNLINLKIFLNDFGSNEQSLVFDSSIKISTTCQYIILDAIDYNSINVVFVVYSLSDLIPRIQRRCSIINFEMEQIKIKKTCLGISDKLLKLSNNDLRIAKNYYEYIPEELIDELFPIKNYELIKKKLSSNISNYDKYKQILEIVYKYRLELSGIFNYLGIKYFDITLGLGIAYILDNFEF